MTSDYDGDEKEVIPWVSSGGNARKPLLKNLKPDNSDHLLTRLRRVTTRSRSVAHHMGVGTCV